MRDWSRPRWLEMRSVSDICPAAFCATVMMVRRMNVDSMSPMSAPRNERKTSADFSWLVL